MNKYDKMIECNKKQSDEKVAAAVAAIHKLLQEQERVSVPKLMKLTGYSRGFFYKNSVVRREFDEAIEKQAGVVDPRRKIINQAMDNRIMLLQQQLQQLETENERLKQENSKLQKALSKRNLNLVKSL